MANAGERWFVGRLGALSVLKEELAKAHEGPRIVCVEGEAGIGKTSLVRRFLAGAAAEVTLWAAADEDETGLAFGLMSSVGRALRANGNEDLLLGRNRDDADPFAVGAELLAALGGIEGVTVLVIDDLHWADVESARALMFALRRLEGESLLVVVVSRPESSVRIGDGWARLLADPERARPIVLGGLGAAELRQLAEDAGHGTLDMAAAQRLHAHTDGHPLHARALIEELGARVINAATRILPAPRSLASLVQSKVAVLDEACRHLLGAASVLGVSAPLALVAQVGRVADPVAALEAAMAADLLERLPDGDVRFPHPLIRAAVYNGLPPTRLVELHTRAATVTDGLSALGHRVAAAAGPDPELAEELECVGVEALVAGRVSTAVTHLRGAAGLWARATDRERCLLLAVEAPLTGGDRSQLVSARPLIEAFGPSPHRSYMLGYMEFAAGHIGEAERLLSEAVGGLAAAPHATEGRAAVWLGFYRLMLGRFDEAVGPSIVGARTPGWGRGTACLSVAMCLQHLGQEEELGRFVEHLRTEVMRGGRADIELWAAIGLIRFWLGDLAEAVDDLRAVAGRGRAGETAHLLNHGLATLAEAYYWLGQWDQAVVYSELSVSLSRDTEQMLALQHGHEVACDVHAGRGELEVAERHLAAAVELDRLMPWWVGASGVALARGTLATARHDPDGVLRAATDLLSGPMAAAARADPRTALLRVLAADALVDTGDAQGARRMLAGVSEVTARGWLRRLEADTARLHGRIAELEGDPKAAAACYEQAPKDPSVLPLSVARVELAHGALLRRTGERRSATELLRSARLHLAVIGADPLVAECDVELQACGLRTPKRRGGTVLELTGAEQTVSLLVAEGLSNREVADRLYVSVKAVEYHLSRVYAKLGIASRRQLADRLRSTPDSAGGGARMGDVSPGQGRTRRN